MVIVAVIFAALLLVSLFYLVTRRERYTPPAVPPHRLTPTSEVHVDPETGSRQRVWVDPVSGTRTFLDENVAPGTPGFHQPPALPVPHATWLPGAPPATPRLVDAAPPGGSQGPGSDPS